MRRMIVFWGMILVFASGFGMSALAFSMDGKTPGREEDEEAEKRAEASDNGFSAQAAAILEGLGGRDNIISIDNCVTRLRLEIKDDDSVDEKKIKAAGVAGVIRPGKNSVQVVVGTKVQFVAEEFKKLCK